jgi:DNA polymerase-4
MCAPMFVKWLFLDMNSFFASVEQQERRDLRGKPVGVVPVMAETTSCIAASYEARAYGVKTGTRVDEARRLCPHITIIEAVPNLYRQYSDAIREVVESCLPITQMLSVDEMVCRLWDNERDLADALKLGQRIQEEIHGRVGTALNCSVGLGPNPLLAKVAAEMHKPHGLSVIDRDDLPRKLFRLELRDWPGISGGMEARFHKEGVHTTEQMYALGISEMRKIYGGIEGERWWRKIRGEDLDAQPTRVGSISHSYVLPTELRNPRDSRGIAGRLLEKAAERLRHSGYHAQALALRVRSYDEGFWERADRFPARRDTFSLMQILRSLGEHPFQRPSQIAVTLFSLIKDENVTASLFDDPGVPDAMEALDAVNRRFGRTKVCLASVHDYKAHAQDKIAFGRVADLAPIREDRVRLL